MGIVGPSGWTLLAYDEASADTKIVVYGKFATKDSESDVTISTTGGPDHIVAGIVAFVGVDPANPVAAAATARSTGSVSSLAVPALTSPGDERGLVYVAGAAGSSPTLTVTAPSGMFGLTGSVGLGTTGSVLVASGLDVYAGSTGAGSVSRSPSGSICAAAILLNPVPPPPVAEATGTGTITVSGSATGRRAAAGVGGTTAGFAASAGLRGAAALDATSSAALVPAGTLRGAAGLAGVVALAIAASAGIGGVAGLAGATALQVSQEAPLAGMGALAGVGSAALTGTASGIAIPGLGGYGSVGLDGAGLVQGTGAVSGTSSSTLTWAASLSGNVPATGAATVSIAQAANLRAVAALATVASASFTAAAVPSGSAAASGAVPLAMSAMPAALRGEAALGGDAAAGLVANGAMQLLVRGSGSTEITFVLEPATLLSMLPLDGASTIGLGAQAALVAGGVLRGAGTWGVAGAGQALRIVDPVVENHWRVPSRRPVLLLTIGAPPLPVVTPIVPVDVTNDVDDHVAPELAAPFGLTAVAMLDGAHLAWSYDGLAEASFVVEVAQDVAGLPSGWAIAGGTANRQYTLGGLTEGTVWVRVYATLNGRSSGPAAPVSVTPIPSFKVQANTEAVAALQQHVETIDGVLEAQATDIVSLKAGAEAVANELGGLQEATDALAAADDLMAARVQAAEDSISAEAQRVTALSSSLEISRSVAGRTPLVFRQPSAPAVSGTRYNLLLQTAGLTSITWAKTATVAASTVADPEGHLQAFRLTPSADGQYVRQDVSGLGSIAGRTFSFPVWIRADIAHTCSIRLITGSAGTAEVLDVAAVNLWQRVNITHVYAGETDASLRVEIYPKQFGSTGQPNHSIDVFGPQLNEGAVRPFQRVGVANDYDGNGIPPLSTWYDSDDGNKEYGWQLSGGSMQWVVGSDTRIAATAAAAEELGTRVAAAEGAIVAQADDISTLNVRLTGNVNAVEALQVRVSSTEDGIEDYFASYSVTFDVNGKFSGFRSINNGLISAFEIDADVFSVTAAAGADALTWSGGVLTAKKGGYSVKLGPGFGANSDLVLWYGASGDSSTCTVENAKIAITKDGTRKLGSTQLNLGSGWSSGASISYSATAGSATISATAGVFRFGDQERSYGASSASVSGTPGTSVLYWLYYDDPGLTGGAKALMVSTNVVDTFNSDGRVLLGAVTVAYPASGTSGGGGSGGSDCVDYDSVLPDGRLVRDLQPGDLVECVDVRTGIRSLAPLLAISFGWADCYRVTTAHGEVIQSDTTPMDMPDGSVVRTHALSGHPVLQREHGFEPAAIEYLGPRRVCKPDLGDRMFFAGTKRHRCIATHNIRYKDPTLP